MLTLILNSTLIAICVAGAIGCVWAVFLHSQRAPPIGRGFWASNFAGTTIRHAAIFFGCWIVFVAAFLSLIVLNHGWDELKNLLSTIRAGAPKH